MSYELKQTVAMMAGGIMGLICLAGLLLRYRRFSNARLAAVSTTGDKVLLLWILGALLLDLATIFKSAQHSDGDLMVRLMMWAQNIVIFSGSAASFMGDTPVLFKAHLFMGMTLFLIFPSPAWCMCGAALPRSPTWAGLGN